MKKMKQGVICLDRIVKSYGMSLSKEDISQKFYSIKEIDISELDDIANKLGFQTLFMPLLSWRDLSTFPLPAILFSFNNDLDFSIVEKVNKFIWRYHFQFFKYSGVMLLSPN